MSDNGFKYIGDKRSIILRALSITTAGTSSDDQQLIALSSRLQEFLDGISGLDRQAYKTTKVYTESDFSDYKGKYAYKIVPQDAYDRFISNGIFLVGSLSRFRLFEEQGDARGDRFEGSAYSAFSVADRELTVSTLAGFDSHIFCLTKDLKNLEQLKHKFGPVVLRFDLLPFTRRLTKLLACQSFGIRSVHYADLKVYRGKLSTGDVIDFPPKLTARLARALRRNSRRPSIFAKPSRFEDEREVRIAILAEKDVPDHTIVQDLHLLDFVDRIDI